MSAATKKKHVFQETINNYSPPTENQQIVKVKSPRGNNLHDVQTANNEEFIVSMPTKFRKTVWVKRGDFLIVEPIEEGNKVKAEIVQILTKDHIRYLKSQNTWPKGFPDDDEQQQKQKNPMIPDDMMPPSDDEGDFEQEEEQQQQDEKNEQENEENEIDCVDDDKKSSTNINRNYLFNNNNNNNVNNPSNDVTTNLNKFKI